MIARAGANNSRDSAVSDFPVLGVHVMPSQLVREWRYLLVDGRVSALMGRKFASRD